MMEDNSRKLLQRLRNEIIHKEPAVVLLKNIGNKNSEKILRHVRDGSTISEIRKVLVFALPPEDIASDNTIREYVPVWAKIIQDRAELQVLNEINLNDYRLSSENPKDTDGLLSGVLQILSARLDNLRDVQVNSFDTKTEQILLNSIKTLTSVADSRERAIRRMKYDRERLGEVMSIMSKHFQATLGKVYTELHGKSAVRTFFDKLKGRLDDMNHESLESEIKEAMRKADKEFDNEN